MFSRLLLLFIIVPILELALLIQVGRWIGLLPTLALVVGTGILGAALAGREGPRAWRAFQLDIWEGRIPGRPILDGLSIFAGGALLLTPGLVTDLLGFTLLLRPTRRWLQDRVVKRVRGTVLERGEFYIRTPSGWAGRPARPESREPRRPAGREIEP